MRGLGLLHSVSGSMKTLCKQFHLDKKSYISALDHTHHHASRLKTPNKHVFTQTDKVLIETCPLIEYHSLDIKSQSGETSEETLAENTR